MIIEKLCKPDELAAENCLQLLSLGNGGTDSLMPSISQTAIANVKRFHNDEEKIKARLHNHGKQC